MINLPEAIEKFKVGQSFQAIIPFSQPNKIKIHIIYILPSIHKFEKLIIYKVFGKHKRWWHEFMCSDEVLQWYKEKAK